MRQSATMRMAWTAVAFLCACTAEPRSQVIEQAEDPPQRGSSPGWAGWAVQPEQPVSPSPPPVAAPPDSAPRIELVEHSDCTYPELAGFPAISEDGEIVAFKQWDSSTELLELVLRPLSEGKSTRVTLSTEQDGMCFAEPTELATLERRVGQARRALARKRWRSMPALPYHVDFVRDLGRQAASCAGLDLAATADALRRDWPANRGTPTWLLTCANQPRVTEVLVRGLELIVREPGIAVLARRPVPEVIVTSLAPGECAPQPQIERAWFDETHHVLVAMVTQRDSYMCEYPYRMISVALELAEPHAPLAFPPDAETMQSEIVLRHLSARTTD
jgi:hypothetical protein